MHRRCCRLVTWSPAGCKHSQVLLKMGGNYRPEHVELIEIISKIIIVASSWLFILLHAFYFFKSKVLFYYLTDRFPKVRHCPVDRPTQSFFRANLIT